jgi:zinc transporter ZupT
VFQRWQPKPRGSKLARFSAWLASASLLAGFAILVSRGDDPYEIAFGVSNGLKVALALWVAGAVLSVAVLLYTLRAWRRRWWRVAGRISFTLVAAAAAGTVLWLNYWNLLGWRY